MPKKPAPVPRGTITVLAGVNGAGKSSVAGAYIRAAGGDYYNPDEFTRSLLRQNPGLDPAEANSLAWTRGKELLEHAIADSTDFVFETTLGANTIPQLLARAATNGMAVKIYFVGLASVAHHLRRVAARVASGGHDIPEVKIRERWENSRLNLVRLLPHLAELMVWDNSAETDFTTGAPKPVLLLHLRTGVILAPKNFTATPDWAKPIVAAALKLQSSL
ncbi:MAG: zeta toxin family protein [Opitutaceae bacterium]|nr:zeta toxin family protein [Opitutaceae bacterium]